MALPFGQHDSLIRGARLMRELIDTESVRVLYQPIVDLRTRAVVAYEALGRGMHPDLTQKPAELLQLAASCNLSAELSQLFRVMAVRGASRLRAGSTVFLNVHPDELVSPSFIASLEAIEPPPCGTYRFVLEIAESSVTDVAAMTKHREAFAELGFEFAYDDFGAGQARLLELCDIPPHYLKLDTGVVQGIEGVKARQEVVRALLSVIGSLGVQIVAEGIETEPVALMCQELGCQLGQGYLFGRPM
jgi:EAL domain-containing protein (putative c-di-GMP-specific phosphodiesterase class I)